MLNKLIDWLKHAEHTEEDPKKALQLATAVLLFEVIRADDNQDESEINKYQQVLEAKFSLTERDVEVLIAEAEKASEQSVDLYQYTQVINQHCQQSQKQQILQSLWEVAYADGHLDADEEHIIRRLADLLHISHSNFIKTKLKANT